MGFVKQLNGTSATGYKCSCIWNLSDPYSFGVWKTGGYRNCQGRGFGYFRDYDKLVNMLKEYAVPIENIIAFSFNGNTEEFIDTTV